MIKKLGKKRLATFYCRPAQSEALHQDQSHTKFHFAWDVGNFTNSYTARKLFILLLIGILTSGCTLYKIDSQDSSTDFYPIKSTHNVIHLELIDRPHEIIGYVIVEAERRQYVSEVIQKMKREAAIIGGDAITNIKSDATGRWKSLPAQEFIGNGYVRANFTADVVVFK